MTNKENCNNRIYHKKYRFQGKLLTASQIADEVGKPESLIRGRLNRGWKLQKAINTPKLEGPERYTSGKLKPEEVLEIRKKLQNGTSDKELASHFKVTLRQIRRINRREVWAHI